MSDSVGILAESPPPPSSAISDFIEDKTGVDVADNALTNAVDEAIDRAEDAVDELSWADPDVWIGIFAISFLVMVFLPLLEFEVELADLLMGQAPLPHFLFRHKSTSRNVCSYQMGLALISLNVQLFKDALLMS